MRTKMSGTDRETDRKRKPERAGKREENASLCYVTCIHYVAISSTISLSVQAVLWCSFLKTKWTWYLSR